MQSDPAFVQSSPSSSNRLRDILLLVFGLLAMLVLLGRGIYLLVTSFIPLKSSQPSADLSTNIYGAISMLFCAVLLIPLVDLSIRHLRGKAINLARIPPIKLWQVFALIGAWVVSVILSAVLGNLKGSGWLAALPFFLLGIAIPIVTLIWIAAGGIPAGSWRRLWASFNLGMTASTMIALGLELLVMGAAVAVVAGFAALNPGLRATLQELVRQYQQAHSVQDLLPILTPYLNNPLVFLGILLMVAVAGPLIEEAFKPLAVWLVGRRLHSTGEGFVLGALCGAGFALLEGMLVTSGSSEMLGYSVAGRATSSLMHITASGLMGWGIASALLEKRYGRLLLVYLLSTTIHGLWNGSVLLTVYGGLRMTPPLTKVDLLGSASILLGLGILGIMLLVYLLSTTIHGLWNGSVLLTVYGGLRMTPPLTKVDLLGSASIILGLGILGIMLLAILIVLPIINQRLRPAPVVQAETPVPTDVVNPISQ